MRIAHLITVHKNPAQVEWLLRALAHEEADCYVHVDKNVDMQEFAYLARLPRVYLTRTRVAVHWASYRFTEAILACTREILATGHDYDFINLLSGQDYPIKPVDVIHAFLARHLTYSFMSFEREGSLWWGHARSRVEKYHTTYYQFKGQYWLQNLLNKFLPKRRFPLPYTLYGSPNGSWWTMSRACATYLVEFMAGHPELQRFSRFTWGADEFLPATVLLNSPLRDRIINNNYRYIDWSAGGVHPKLLTRADVPRLAQSGQLYARKFDIAEDAGIIDVLDQTLLHPTPLAAGLAMNTPLYGRDIVVVGQQPWDTAIGSNCKDIARVFSRHNRVLYVNAPLDRNTLLRQRRTPAVQQRLRVLRGQEPGLQAVAEQLWVLTPATILESINWLPAGLHTWFNKRNNRRFAATIRAAAAELGFARVLLFNDNDIFRSFYLPELLKPEVSIYYSRDYVVATDYWKKHGLRLEPQLIAKSDVCVANSSYLAGYCRQYNAHSCDVGQGCDAPPAAIEADDVIPPDLAALPRPIIGYVGALVSARLSVEVLRHISQQRPEWSVVLIGPEDKTFKSSDLHGLPNVHFLGAKLPATLPGYMQHFDVCLNPQVLNDLTRGNYPRKVDEYLLQGRPVVASRTEAMHLFEAHAYLADTAQDYVRLIARALREDNPARQQQRRAFAATHTWENSVGKIYQAVAAHYARLAPAARPAMPHPQPAVQ